MVYTEQNLIDAVKEQKVHTAQRQAIITQIQALQSQLKNMPDEMTHHQNVMHILNKLVYQGVELRLLVTLNGKEYLLPLAQDTMIPDELVSYVAYMDEVLQNGQTPVISIEQRVIERETQEVVAYGFRDASWKHYYERKQVELYKRIIGE